MLSRLQVSAHPEQMLALLGRQGRRLLSAQRLHLVFQFTHGREGGIPPPLEFGGNKAIVGINHVILASSPDRLVSPLLERQLDLASFLASHMLAFRDARTAASTPSGCSNRTISAPTA
jgi:hypothetical protein